MEAERKTMVCFAECFFFYLPHVSWARKAAEVRNEKRLKRKRWNIRRDASMHSQNATVRNCLPDMHASTVTANVKEHLPLSTTSNNRETT